MNRRGFFAAIVGAPTLIGHERVVPLSEWGRPTKAQTLQIGAVLDAESIRRVVGSREFADALAAAVRNNSHNLRGKLRDTLT